MKLSTTERITEKTYRTSKNAPVFGMSYFWNSVCILGKHTCDLHLYGHHMNTTVVPTKSDRGVMFCLQSYQGLRIDRLLVY